MRQVQKDRVLDYMEQNGGITTQQAFRDLGITRLSARIADLKAAGIRVVGEMIEVEDRYGEKTRVKRYEVAR